MCKQGIKTEKCINKPMFLMTFSSGKKTGFNGAYRIFTPKLLSGPVKSRNIVRKEIVLCNMLRRMACPVLFERSPERSLPQLLLEVCSAV